MNLCREAVASRSQEQRDAPNRGESRAFITYKGRSTHWSSHLRLRIHSNKNVMNTVVELFLFCLGVQTVLSGSLPFVLPPGCRRSSECTKLPETTLTHCSSAQKCISVSSRKTPPNNLPFLTPLRKLSSKKEILGLINSTPGIKGQKARLSIIDISIIILRDIHPHRNIHTKMLRADPVPLLQRLRTDVTTSKPMSNFAFYLRMWTIFTGIRDFHTLFGPFVLRDTEAFLPFAVGDYYVKPGSAPRFVLLDVAIGFKPANMQFKKGVEIVTWDGRPVQQAVLRGASSSSATNVGARLRVGIASLTWRQLARGSFPNKESVVIGFRESESMKGPILKITVKWIFTRPFPDTPLPPQSSERLVSLSASESLEDYTLDPEHQDYAKDGFKEGQMEAAERQTSSGVEITPVKVRDCARHIFSADIIRTDSATFGRIVMFTFTTSPFLLAEEYLRLLNILPKSGLVLDIRGNGGGVFFNEFVMLFPITKKEFAPTSFALRVTSFTKRAVEKTTGEGDGALGRFKESTIAAFKAGRPFSAPRTLYNETRFRGFTGNIKLRGVSPRPTIVLTDGRTYSAAEDMTALVRDNDLGYVVGVDLSTGGGASTTSGIQRLPQEFLEEIPDLQTSDIGVSTSVLKLLRTGKRKGKNFEFVGVKPDERYFLTRRDRTGSEEEFMNFLGNMFRRIF